MPRTSEVEIALHTSSSRSLRHAVSRSARESRHVTEGHCHQESRRGDMIIGGSISCFFPTARSMSATWQSPIFCYLWHCRTDRLVPVLSKHESQTKGHPYQRLSLTSTQYLQFDQAFWGHLNRCKQNNISQLTSQLWVCFLQSQASGLS